MAEIPDNPVTMVDLFLWYELQEELSRVKAKEMLLRQKIFKHYFPTPKEGTNTMALDDGYELKGVHVVNRKVDEGPLNVLKDELVKRNIRVADLVERKPSLIVRAYRQLTEEERTYFDQCLEIKPGSPALEIVLPKSKGKTKA